MASSDNSIPSAGSTPSLVWFINKTITSEFRQALVAHAARTADDLPIGLSGKLRDAILNSTGVDISSGSWNSTLASYQQTLVEATHRDNDLLAICLLVWNETNRFLRQISVGFLNEKGFLTFDQTEQLLSAPPHGYWSTAEIRTLLNSFLTRNPIADRYKVAVMLYMLSGYAYMPKYLKQETVRLKNGDTTVTEQQIPDTDPFTSMLSSALFNTCLTKLQSLSESAVEWDEVETFVEHIRAIAEAKKDAYESIELLRKQIRRFEKVPEQLVNYFGFTNTQTWSLEGLASADIPRLTDSVVRLHEMLEKYYDLRIRQPQNLAEAREQREKLVRLEDQIVHDYQSLDVALSSHRSIEIQDLSSTTPDTINKVPVSVQNKDVGTQQAELPFTAVIPVSSSSGGLAGSCLRFPIQADYAIQVVSYLAKIGDYQRTRVSEIAEKTGIPSAFLAKIVSQLAASGIVTTSRGAGGGLQLSRPASEVFLADVIEATTGLGELVACDDACPRFGKCALYELLDECHDMLYDRFAGTSF